MTGRQVLKEDKVGFSVDKNSPWEGSSILLASSTIDTAYASFLIAPADIQEFKKLRSLGFTVFQTDSDHLGTNEVEEGVWDWHIPDTHLKACQSAGGKWFWGAHFHCPPLWFQKGTEFVPMKCLEHNAHFPGWSIWHPKAIEFQDRGYHSLWQQYGDRIYVLWTGIHGDYGENEYPAGYRFSNEVQAKEWRDRFGDCHNHSGWWCQDEFAQADFRERMINKYGTLESLNNAWETNFVTQDEIAYPASVDKKRYWLDFVQWYLDSMTRFSAAVTKAAIRYFPGTRVLWLLGGPGENPRLGQDQSALVKAAGELKTEIRSTHGGFQPFAKNYATMLKRIASACKFYNVPFWSEPPCTVGAAGTVGRIFESVSCGSAGYYDWAWNPLEPSVGKIYEKYGCYLTQEKAVVDVALFYPTTHNLMNANKSYPELDYPQRFKEAASDLREVFDFDILDEQMIADGALDRYRVLIFLEGNVMEAATIQTVAGWVSNGGVAVTYDAGRVETVEGDAGPWLKMFGIAGDFAVTGKSFSIPDAHSGFLRHLSQKGGIITDQVCCKVASKVRVLAGNKNEAVVWANPIGDGWAVMFAGSWKTKQTYYELLRDVVYHLSAFDAKKKDALVVDDEWDGVYSTLFEGGRVLFYNPTDEKKIIDIMGTTLELEPVSLGHVKVCIREVEGDLK